jgi:hypothetical protein
MLDCTDTNVEMIDIADMSDDDVLKLIDALIEALRQRHPTLRIEFSIEPP